MLLNETWISNNDHLNLDIGGYISEHIFGNKSIGTRKGRYSGGISIYYKNSLKDKIKVVEKHQIGILWLKISKDIFSFNQDVYICVSYIPPAGSKVIRNDDIDLFEQLEIDIIKYKNLGVVYLTGDLNSRTSNEPDFFTYDRYLDDEDIFAIDSHIHTRVNKDHVLDTHGRRLLLLCQTSDLIITNGRTLDDCNIGQHTFVCKKGMSVVDYLLASHDDITFLSHFKILDFNEFSDHAPVFFAFLSQNPSKENKRSNVTRLEQKIIFDESKSPLFRAQLMNSNDQLQRLTDSVNNRPVDCIVNSFTDYIYASAVLVYGKNININTQQKSSNFSSNKWFDKDCSEARNEFKQARNIFVRNKNSTNRKSFVTARTKYNRTKSRAKQRLKIKEGKNICNLAKKQPKKFWKSIINQNLRQNHLSQKH